MAISFKGAHIPKEVMLIRAPQWDRVGVWLWATEGCRFSAPTGLVGTVSAHDACLALLRAYQGPGA